ncbi:MAG: cysteine synthase A [Clostridiales bacterium]|uniref:Cysteine synthase n=1 Tax=Candidatus Pullilachnospira stercoravium TaxID=2840913 RepID=A0A9D1T6X5_9FIRM|nr:cysteine synthase A [Clostridiales bacterium]HIV14110.1 cysteine synthase A [Candidatus Pullilachnospira stercoravium]
MAGIKQEITEIVGNTPLLRMRRLEEKKQMKAAILAKLEYLNPTGSVKDRAALYMIRDAEEKGLLRAGGTIIEPTSGNTGIGLAAIAAAKGYQVILTMPETMSQERRNMLKAYGARLVLTEGSLGMAGAVAKAEELHREIPGSIIAGQFDNPANARAHRETTGPEIWRDTEGRVDILVAGVGTGGTLTGTGEYLKEKNPAIQVVAVEPQASPLLSRGRSGSHGIQGIGANFIPQVLNRDIYDQVIAVGDKDAINWAKAIAKNEGILVGISSGAAMYAAARLAEMEENAGKNIVVILPDSGDRYYSTALFL